MENSKLGDHYIALGPVDNDQRPGHDQMITIITDAIVQFDQNGVPRRDREVFWAHHRITKREIEEAEEQVEIRYKVAKFKRKSRMRRW